MLITYRDFEPGFTFSAKTVILKSAVEHLEPNLLHYLFRLNRNPLLQILNLAARGADQIDMWLDVWLVAIVRYIELHNFKETYPSEDAKSIVNSSQTDSGIFLLYLTKDLSSAGMRGSRGQIINDGPSL